jgi:hypothetical protein
MAFRATIRFRTMLIRMVTVIRRGLRGSLGRIACMRPSTTERIAPTLRDEVNQIEAGKLWPFGATSHARVSSR